jgi:hypothetical protein
MNRAVDEVASRRGRNANGWWGAGHCPSVRGKVHGLAASARWCRGRRWAAKGRDFVAGAPTVAELWAFGGRPAVEPIRVSAGLESASSPREQAALVVAELERTRAFSRRVLCVITTTGTGWVDQHSSAWPWRPCGRFHAQPSTAGPPRVAGRGGRRLACSCLARASADQGTTPVFRWRLRDER